MLREDEREFKLILIEHGLLSDPKDLLDVLEYRIVELAENYIKGLIGVFSLPVTFLNLFSEYLTEFWKAALDYLVVSLRVFLRAPGFVVEEVIFPLLEDETVTTDTVSSSADLALEAILKVQSNVESIEKWVKEDKERHEKEINKNSWIAKTLWPNLLSDVLNTKSHINECIKIMRDLIKNVSRET